MKVKTLTGLLAGVLVAAMGLWPTEGLTMNSDANKIYVPRGGDERQKLPKNPGGWEVIRDVYAPIGDLSDWRKLVEARRANHWKPGNSAHATALSWFNANPELPREINALLGGAELLAATPEHETPLAGKGGGSHSDVLAFVNMRGARCVVTVEGKVDEKFSNTTVEAWFKEAKTERARNNRTKRLDGIYAELGLTNPAADKIRYQLLHRAAAAVIEAKRFGADCAAMVVQSFSLTHAWFEDFAEFLKLFGINSAKRDTLYETDMPGMPLYFGWASSVGTIATAATPGKTESQPAQVAEVVALTPDSAATPIKTQSGFLVDNLVWIVSGVLVLVLAAGIFFWPRKSKDSDVAAKVDQPVENAPAQTVEADDLAATANNTQMVDANKVKGDKFEDYVISKFNMLTESEKKDPFLKRHGRHILLERRSDKGEDGVFPESNKHPDLEIGCYLYQDKNPHKFAVECKFRRDYMNGKVQFVSQKKLADYKEYARKNDMPTFIVLGVGGYSNDPQRMFVIPLDRLNENNTELTTEQLADYVQPGKKKSFFYHCNDRWLKFD